MITVLGIGPGSPNLRLQGTDAIITKAELVIGSDRQLAEFDIPAEKQLVLPKLEVLKKLLAEQHDQNVVLLASGDPLLYGIGSWTLRQFGSDCVTIVPGISSIQYMFHQVGLAMNDTYLTSSHGRLPDFDFLLAHKTVGMVTDDEIGPYQIAQEVLKRHQHRTIYIGEQLSYPEEKISQLAPEQVENQKYNMNVVIITNA
ncbi:cobalt-precorrin-7 (C(5))-methyltransferase [Secundilactobacillus collinoides]|uniref:cobalt-precorrin-7 (C(5))-methyltransferase n=1 Tax=Secundilactobacillus collinoides TaxID=33960 RepID=UPI000704C239|nr:cobalt-precorrin-7 (C(5))-methyltransferase [Secundilactobacillus collinoides]